MNKTNSLNEKQVKISFLEKLTHALENNSNKVSTQYLCSSPSINSTSNSKVNSKQLSSKKA